MLTDYALYIKKAAVNMPDWDLLSQENMEML